MIQRAQSLPAVSPAQNKECQHNELNLISIILVYRDISNKNIRAVINGVLMVCVHTTWSRALLFFPAVKLQFSENLTNKTINFDYNKKLT